MVRKYNRVYYRILLLLMFIAIYSQTRLVGLYFDDYGYATLSYGWDNSQVGLHYGIKEIIDYLTWHYFNWGGRVFFYFIYIVIVRLGGVVAVQLAQSIIVFFIIYFSEKLIEIWTNNKKYQIATLVILFALYASMAVETVADGLYWYMASVGYVWPLFPFFAACWLNEKNVDGKINGLAFLSSILFFISAISIEQIAVLSTSYCLGRILIDLWRGEGKLVSRLHGAHVLCLGCSGVASAIEILAPGNFARAGIDMYTEQNGSFIEKCIKNVAQIVYINVGTFNWLLCLILCVFVGIGIALAYKNKVRFVFWLVASLFFVSEYFFLSENELILIISRAVFVVGLVFEISIHYWIKQKYLPLLMFYAGIASQAVMIIVPVIPMRSHIIFEFVLHLIIVDIVMDVVQELFRQNKTKSIKYVKATFAVLLALAVCNYAFIWNGYYRNSLVANENASIMEETAKAIKSGEKIERIVLTKLLDDRFGNKMPYQEGGQYISYWMLDYYEIPRTVLVEWE